MREAEVAATERKPAAAQKPNSGGSKSDAARRGSGRVKAVWVVLDPSFKSVATFEYRDRTLAEQKALDLTQQKGKPHVVRSDRVTMDG